MEVKVIINRSSPLSSDSSAQSSSHCHQLYKYSAKISMEYLYADWVRIICYSSIERLTWIFNSGHAGMQGDERADSPAGKAVIDNNLTIDIATVI